MPGSGGRASWGVWLPAAWLVVMLALAVGADLLPFADPTQTRAGAPNAGPSLDHLLGTDALGRDVLSRVAHGAQVSLAVGVGATAIGLVVGGALGLVAGYRRGRFDGALMAATDVALAFPALVLALAVVTFAGASFRNVLLTMGILGVPPAVRLVRSATLAVAEREYVTASRVLGARSRATVAREVLPNVALPASAFACLGIAVAIVAEGALAFLGLSVQPPTPTWGGMIEESRTTLEVGPWATYAPAGAMFLTVLALNLLSDGVRARTDVRGGALRPVPRRERMQAPPAVVDAPDGPDDSDGPDGDAILAVDGLRTTFPTPDGDVVATDGVSLRLGRGRTLGIVGESGSGKSVLIRSILGLLPAGVARREGRVWVDGADLSGRDAGELRHVLGTKVGAVFQDPSSSLNPVRTIGTQLAEPLRVHRGMGRRAARARARELLEAVGIPEPAGRLRQYPHQLSGGMRQRVTIALALACDPLLLFADEPTTALDVTVQHQVLRLLHRQRTERDMALVLVSHDLAVVADWADDVVVMYAGRVVEAGPAAVVLGRPRMPYTRALLAAIPGIDGIDGSDGPRRLPVIGGLPPSLLAPPAGCRFEPRCPHARARCAREEPPLVADGDPGHRYACWYPDAAEGAAGEPVTIGATDGR